MEASPNQPQKGRRGPAAPRIDLTPMVDLAFLLITFFIFNSTLSQPNAMTTLLPADSNDSSKVAQSGAITLIAARDHLLYYRGDAPHTARPIGYSETETLRTNLLSVRQQLMATEGNDDKLFVFIKPTDESHFGQVVQLLDEMTICQMKRYTLAELNDAEKKWYAQQVHP